MKHRDPQLYLYDAAGACDRIMRFVAGSSVEDYLRHEMMQSAVERQLIILGEALTRLRAADHQLIHNFPDTDAVIGLRNRLVHGYEGINSRLIWLTSQTGVPGIRKAIGDVGAP